MKFRAIIIVLFLSNVCLWHAYGQRNTSSADLQRWHEQVMTKTQNEGKKWREELARSSQFAMSSVNKEIYVLYSNGNSFAAFTSEIACRQTMNGFKLKLESLLTNLTRNIPSGEQRPTSSEIRTIVNECYAAMNLSYRREDNPKYRPPATPSVVNQGGSYYYSPNAAHESNNSNNRNNSNNSDSGNNQTHSQNDHLGVATTIFSSNSAKKGSDNQAISENSTNNEIKTVEEILSGESSNGQAMKQIREQNNQTSNSSRNKNFSENSAIGQLLGIKKQLTEESKKSELAPDTLGRIYQNPNGLSGNLDDYDDPELRERIEKVLKIEEEKIEAAKLESTGSSNKGGEGFGLSPQQTTSNSNSNTTPAIPREYNSNNTNNGTPPPSRGELGEGTKEMNDNGF